jgi:hypothetical protein
MTFTTSLGRTVRKRGTSYVTKRSPITSIRRGPVTPLTTCVFTNCTNRGRSYASTITTGEYRSTSTTCIGGMRAAFNEATRLLRSLNGMPAMFATAATASGIAASASRSFVSPTMYVGLYSATRVTTYSGM